MELLTPNLKTSHKLRKSFHLLCADLMREVRLKIKHELMLAAGSMVAYKTIAPATGFRPPRTILCFTGLVLIDAFFGTGRIKETSRCLVSIPQFLPRLKTGFTEILPFWYSAIHTAGCLALVLMCGGVDVIVSDITGFKHGGGKSLRKNIKNFNPRFSAVANNISSPR